MRTAKPSRAARLAARRHDIAVGYLFARRQGLSPARAQRVARLYVALDIVQRFRTWRSPADAALRQHWCDRDNALESALLSA